MNDFVCVWIEKLSGSQQDADKIIRELATQKLDLNNISNDLKEIDEAVVGSKEILNKLPIEFCCYGDATVRRINTRVAKVKTVLETFSG